MTMDTQTSSPTTVRGTAALVVLGPVSLLGAMLWHPPLPGRLPDNDAVAEAAAADLTRWGLVHLATAIAVALVVVAFVAVRGFLRERGDGWPSAVGLGCVVLGSTLYAVLPGMEFAVLAAHETGGDPAATQAALESWFTATLVSGAAVFAVGTALFAAAVVRTGTFGRTEAVVIAGALVVFGLSRLVPVGAVQFYVQPAAALLALLPIAAEMSARAHRGRVAG